VIRIVYYVYELNIIQKCWCFSREKIWKCCCWEIIGANECKTKKNL